MRKPESKGGSRPRRSAPTATQAAARRRPGAGDRHRLSAARHPRGRRLARARRARAPLVRAGRGRRGGRGAGAQGADPRLSAAAATMPIRAPRWLLWASNRFSWGYRMLEIRPRHHAEGGPLLRHVRAPRADSRRRRRRDGADALGRRGDPRILRADRRPRKCRRRRHPRRAGRGPPLVHHPVRPQRDHRLDLGDGRRARRDVADRQGGDALRGRELRAADGRDEPARGRSRRGSCSKACR